MLAKFELECFVNSRTCVKVKMYAVEKYIDGVL